MKLALYAALLSGLPAYIHAQVLVEAGVLTGATATSAGAAGKGIGKALSSAFGNAEKTLKGAAQPQSTVPAPREIAATAGMAHEELLAKFGNPSQKMTIPDGGHLIERFRYHRDQESVKVILEDGKVKEAFSIPPGPVIGSR